jgi:hypothetical protein
MRPLQNDFSFSVIFLGVLFGLVPFSFRRIVALLAAYQA